MTREIHSFIIRLQIYYENNVRWAINFNIRLIFKNQIRTIFSEKLIKNIVGNFQVIMLSPPDFLAILPSSFRPPPTFAPKKVKSRV